jgi:hypothetical protein
MSTRTALLALLGLALACHAPKKAIPPPGADDLVAGTLVFSDDFERADLGAAWKADGPTWSIVAGRLADAGAKNAGLWLHRDLPADVRVEFDAWSLTPKDGSKYRGDVKCEAFGDARAHESGYSFIMGGWENRLSVLAKQGEHARDRLEKPGRPVPADQVVHWALVRRGGSLRWYLDGELYLQFDDPAVLTGGAFGFNNWLSQLRFDDVRVFDLGS